MQTQTRYIPIPPTEPTPADEVQHVADYQAGWNDAQRGKHHKFEASIYYSMGFVDGAQATGSLQ